MVTKNALFRSLDASAKEVERRFTQVRKSTRNKPVADEILQTKRTISQLGAKVTKSIMQPSPPRSRDVIITSTRRLTD